MKLEEIALLMLASGASSRFADGDKLLAPLNEQPVILHTAQATRDMAVAGRYAVIGPKHPTRKGVLQAAGWNTVTNQTPTEGLASSLAVGVSKVMNDTQAKGVLVLLADMPFVPRDHLLRLADTCDGSIAAVMSDVGSRLTPPALFTRATFKQIIALKGDQGARHLFKALEDTATVPLAKQHAIDIDTVENLRRATIAGKATND